MNRDIKFRAWDYDKKKMFYHDLDRTSEYEGGVFVIFADKEWRLGEIYYDWGISNDNGTGNDKNYGNGVLMQYTGLKDKFGKEIYEGDVVKEIVLNYDYDEIDNPNVPRYKERVSKIVYRHHGFWVDDEDFGWEGENLWEWGNLEIIGNVYENPELLKIENDNP